VQFRVQVHLQVQSTIDNQIKSLNLQFGSVVTGVVLHVGFHFEAVVALDADGTPLVCLDQDAVLVVGGGAGPTQPHLEHLVLLGVVAFGAESDPALLVVDHLELALLLLLELLDLAAEVHPLLNGLAAQRAPRGDQGQVDQHRQHHQTRTRVQLLSRERVVERHENPQTHHRLHKVPQVHFGEV